jgi:diguanylate cyclase (GGDEF)-like protein
MQQVAATELASGVRSGRFDARVKFAAIGSVLGFAAPLGWLALVSLLREQADELVLYVYLTLTSIAACTAIGALIGHYHERLKVLAARDDLTGLFNQTAFMQTAEFLLQLGIRHGEPIAVVMMDIDHFKSVNDNHNHLVGSHILKEIARILSLSLRKSDLTARFGGDEYVLCLPRTPARSAAEVAERIRKAIEGAVFTYRDHTVRVTVSIGVATATCVPGLELRRLAEVADAALYKAKAAGRNAVVAVPWDEVGKAKASA